MLDPILRPIKDVILAPAAIRLTAVSPNTITVVSTLLGALAAVLLLDQRYMSALVLWLGGRVLDGLDGAVARAASKQSDFGGYIDIVGDFFIYAAIPVALVLGRGAQQSALLALALLLSMYYINAAAWLYLSALLEKRNVGARTRGEVTSVTMPDAVVGGAETIIAYLLLFIMPEFATAIFLIFSTLVAISVMQRLVWARAVLT